MDGAGILALRRSTATAEDVDETSPRHLVLEYYDREQTGLRRYLLFLGVDAETSREVVQDSFLKLHEHLLAGGDRKNLRAWLYRVAHNLARNEQTAYRQRKAEALPEPDAGFEFSAEGASVEEELLSRERARRLRSAIEALTVAQKDSILLRAQGFKYREIAEILNISVSTVGENVQRGLGKLKELL